MSGSGSGSVVGSENPGEQLQASSFTYLVVALIGFFSFCWIRQCLPWFYYPRRVGESNQQRLIARQRRRRRLEGGSEGEGAGEGAGAGEGVSDAADDLSSLSVDKTRNWLKYLWKADEVEEEEEGGFVASAYLSLIRHNFTFVSFLVTVSLAIILPLNILGGAKNPDGTPVNTGFFRSTLSNVDDANHVYLWAHVMVQILQVLVLFGVLVHLFKSISSTDRNFQERGRVEYHTVKLRHLPTQWDEKKLSQKLEKYFPGKILAVRIAYDLIDISDLRKDWQQASIKLEQLTWEEENKGKVREVRVCNDDSKEDDSYHRQHDDDPEPLPPRPPKKVSIWTSWMRKGVRKMKEREYYEMVMRYVEAVLPRAQQNFLNQSAEAKALRNTGIAFISFYDTQTALSFANKEPIFKQVLSGNLENGPNLGFDSGRGAPSQGSLEATKHDPLLTKIKGISIGVSGMNRKMAVSPEEIFWDNLGYTRREHITFKIASTTVVIVIAFLWAIPISILSSFDAMSQLPVVGSFFGRLQENHPTGTGIIQSVGSPLLAIASEQLIRGILTKLASMERPHSKAGLEASFQKKYFIFILCNIFLFQTLFVNGIDAFSKLTGEGDQKLSDAIASIDWTISAVFYINYLLQKGFIGFVMSLFRVTALVGTVIRRAKASTPYQKQKANEQNPFRFSVYFGKSAIYLSIGCLFSTVVPTVTAAVFVLFLMRYWSDKNNILLALPKYDSTAIRPIRIGFYFISIGLLIGQIFLLSLFGIGFTQGSYVLFLPIILTLISFFLIKFGFTYYKNKTRPQHLISYENTADLIPAYLHPALRPLGLDLLEKDVNFYD